MESDHGQYPPYIRPSILRPMILTMKGRRIFQLLTVVTTAVVTALAVLFPQWSVSPPASPGVIYPIGRHALWLGPPANASLDVFALGATVIAVLFVSSVAVFLLEEEGK